MPNNNPNSVVKITINASAPGALADPVAAAQAVADAAKAAGLTSVSYTVNDSTVTIGTAA